MLKRLKFAAQSERFTPEQRSLLEETIDADLAALDGELDKADADGKKEREKQQPKRKPLPHELPRTEFHHEPENTTCQCGCALKRVGEDIAEKLDYAPGTDANLSLSWHAGRQTGDLSGSCWPRPARRSASRSGGSGSRAFSSSVRTP